MPAHPRVDRPDGRQPVSNRPKALIGVERPDALFHWASKVHCQRCTAACRLRGLHMAKTLDLFGQAGQFQRQRVVAAFIQTFHIVAVVSADQAWRSCLALLGPARKCRNAGAAQSLSEASSPAVSIAGPYLFHQFALVVLLASRRGEVVSSTKSPSNMSATDRAEEGLVGVQAGHLHSSFVGHSLNRLRATFSGQGRCRIAQRHLGGLNPGHEAR